jgi:phosphate-selective porin OprO/OprP
LALVVGLAPGVAHGQSLEELEQRFAEQEARLRQQEADLQQMRQQMEQMQAEEQAQAAAGGKLAKSGAVEGRDSVVVDYGWREKDGVRTGGPMPTFKFYEADDAEDPVFTFKPRGRVQIDFDYINPEEGTTGNDVVTECRRCRLGFEGTVFTDWGYTFEVDFADDEVSVEDALIDYGGFGFGDLNIGQYKTPNSLDEQTSSRFITFVERAAFTDAFEFDRRIGVGADGKFLETGTWAAGLFGQNISDTSNGNEGFAAAARGTYAFDLGEGATAAEQRLVHVGASVRYRDLNNDSDDGTVRYRDRPFAHGTDNRYVDTGDLFPVNDDLFAGPEFAIVYDQWSVQAEAGWQYVNQTTPGVDNGLLFGGYIDGSYFLTQNSRHYRSGKFDRIQFQPGQAVTEGGIGAWELAFRLDYINLTDDDANIRGGEQISWIPALNWWPNNYIRFSLDYAYNVVNGGPADLNGPDGNNKINSVVFRSQVDF